MAKLLRIAAKVAAVIFGLLLLLAYILSAETVLDQAQHGHTEVIADARTA